MKNAGKPRVLAISALLLSLAALTTSFSAVAFYCYLYDCLLYTSDAADE